MIQQMKLYTLSQTLDEIITKKNCQGENDMKKSIKRKFIDMLSPNNIDYIFFQHGANSFYYKLPAII